MIMCKTYWGQGLTFRICSASCVHEEEEDDEDKDDDDHSDDHADDNQIQYTMERQPVFVLEIATS